MKLLIVLCALVAIISADWAPRTHEEYIQDRDECFKEENVPEDVAEKIKKHQFPDTREADCTIRCIAKKGGYWDDLNGFDIDRTYDTFKAANMELAKEDMKKCFHFLADAHACTWAAMNMKCLFENKYIRKKTSE